MADPWRVKYDGTCARCGATLLKGTPAVWDGTSRTMRCIECPGLPPTPQQLEPQTVDGGVAGRSARAEHDRREAKRDAAITEAWGTGLIAKVVRAISVEPQSTRAWAIGAAGEEKLAIELDKVPGLRMLHDRRVPGTRGNIDHIVIAPAGVFIVDAKNHKGRLEVRNRGSFIRTDHRLMVNGRDCSSLADGMAWQVEAVMSVLEERGIEPRPPVTPVLCFLRVEWPLIGRPDTFRGVRLEGVRTIKRLLTKVSVVSDPQAEHLTTILTEALPPK